MKSPAAWDKVKLAVNVVWTVGERLRVAYNSSKSETERLADQCETALCVLGFITACAAFVVLDAYGDASSAAAAIARGVLSSGPREAAAPAPAPVEMTSAPVTAPAKGVKHLPYRYPWAVYVPTVILFGLLNYLVLGVTVNEAGTGLVLPAYVEAIQKSHPDSLLARAALGFERDIMGGLFLVGRRVFGGMTGVQWVWVTAWIIHFFELGMCVRICLACHAKPWTLFRYCLCTVTAGFAQLVPLQQARAAYLAETTSSKTDHAAKAPAKTAPAKASSSKAKKSQ